MIKCHLSRIMGEHKMRIIDVARETGLNRSTVTRLYNDDAKQFDRKVLDILCQYFDIGVDDLIEFIPDETDER